MKNIDYFYYYLLQLTASMKDTNSLIRELDSKFHFVCNDSNKSKLYNFIVWLNKEDERNED